MWMDRHGERGADEYLFVTNCRKIQDHMHVLNTGYFNIGISK
jgi:hypothetical protein